MKCDICGDSTMLTTILREPYQSKNIKYVCPDCEREVNDVLCKMRSYLLAQMSTFVKLFMRKKRIKRFTRQPQKGDL
jgi:hypothetical protein